MSNDNVNHPSHYNAYKGLEIIDLVEQMNFCKGNAVKYIARAGLKNPATEIEDLEKAKWYIQREIDRLNKIAEEETPKIEYKVVKTFDQTPFKPLPTQPLPSNCLHCGRPWEENGLDYTIYSEAQSVVCVYCGKRIDYVAPMTKPPRYCGNPDCGILWRYEKSDYIHDLTADAFQCYRCGWRISARGVDRNEKAS